MEQLRYGIAITGSGSAAPSTALDNDDLSQIVATSDDWIRPRTGIRERRLAAPEESLTEFAALAAERALTMAGLSAAELDLIVLATSTPDDLFGSASHLQASLGASRAVAFDLTAACSGFVFGLVTAAQFVRTGAYQNVLLVGADLLSRWLDWTDRSTCVLFGDGAGAAVVRARSDGEDGLLGFEICSDGTQCDALTLSCAPKPRSLLGNVRVGSGHYQAIAMQGRDVYRFAVAQVPEAIAKALHRAQLSSQQLDWLLLHQANQRILDAVAQRLEMPSERVVSNLARYGNTSAASVPLALDEAVRAGQIRSRDIVATAGFGAGLSWGAAIFRWGSDGGSDRQ
ncbi:MAG: 3-oxoacyl-ACP synthase [Cyanobacteria bacterium QS_8_64_29]|nr:MAG: 3-oxoacyl-ACP synthase [Cyanobacteria bacterium QS_8_64_29]